MGTLLLTHRKSYNSKAIRRFRKLRALFKSLRKGSSINAACVAAGMDVSTLWVWRKGNPRIDDRIYEIIDCRIQMVEDAHFKAALDGNVTAQMNFLNNRCPSRWTDKRAVGHQTNITTVGKQLSDDKTFRDDFFGIPNRTAVAPVTAE